MTNNTSNSQPDGAAYLSSGAICSAKPGDAILNQCMVLMATFNGNRSAVGTAFVLGASRNEDNTVIAITARHCLENLHEVFGIYLDRPSWPSNEPRIVDAPWTLLGGIEVGGETAIWKCIWSSAFIDDLAILYLIPVNGIAQNIRFRQPLICFGFPKIGDELWGFGFGNCRSVDHPEYGFETKALLTKGRVIQHFDGTSREERILAALPLADGMSGGPVFWARMLTAIVSSTFPSENEAGAISFVTRVRHIVNFPLSEAPKFGGRKYENVMELATAGIINIMGPNVAPQDELTLVNKHGLTLFVRKEG